MADATRGSLGAGADRRIGVGPILRLFRSRRPLPSLRGFVLHFGPASIRLAISRCPPDVLVCDPPTLLCLYRLLWARVINQIRGPPRTDPRSIPPGGMADTSCRSPPARCELPYPLAAAFERRIYADTALRRKEQHLQFFPFSSCLSHKGSGAGKM